MTRIFTDENRFELLVSYLSTSGKIRTFRVILSVFFRVIRGSLLITVYGSSNQKQNVFPCCPSRDWFLGPDGTRPQVGRATRVQNARNSGRTPLIVTFRHTFITGDERLFYKHHKVGIYDGFVVS